MYLLLVFATCSVDSFIPVFYMTLPKRYYHAQETMMDEETFFKLTHEFTNPESKNFMNTNFEEIARSLNRDKHEHHISPEQALEVSQSLSFLSKLKEKRLVDLKKLFFSFSIIRQCFLL